MRAPRHIIPTGNYPISLGDRCSLGAPLGLCSFVLFYILLIAGLMSGLFWELGIHRREFGGLAYVIIHPLFWIAEAATAIVGGIFGSLTTLALRR